MRWFPIYATAALVVSAAAEDFNIPAVEKVVDAALAKYHDYVAYDGPTGAGTARVANGLSVTAGAEVSDPAYWLADITHQGYAPFGPSGYTVFRNVKDYGAKGK